MPSVDLDTLVQKAKLDGKLLLTLVLGFFLFDLNLAASPCFSSFFLMLRTLLLETSFLFDEEKRRAWEFGFNSLGSRAAVSSVFPFVLPALIPLPIFSFPFLCLLCSAASAPLLQFAFQQSQENLKELLRSFSASLITPLYATLKSMCPSAFYYMRMLVSQSSCQLFNLDLVVFSALPLHDKSRLVDAIYSALPSIHFCSLVLLVSSSFPLFSPLFPFTDRISSSTSSLNRPSPADSDVSGPLYAPLRLPLSALDPRYSMKACLAVAFLHHSPDPNLPPVFHASFTFSISSEQYRNLYACFILLHFLGPCLCRFSAFQLWFTRCSSSLPFSSSSSASTPKNYVHLYLFNQLRPCELKYPQYQVKLNGGPVSLPSPVCGLYWVAVGTKSRSPNSWSQGDDKRMR